MVKMVDVPVKLTLGTVTRFVDLGGGVWVNPAQVAMVRRTPGGAHTAVVFATGGSEVVPHPVDEVLAALTAESGTTVDVPACPPFGAWVRDAGGGFVGVVVDRDTGYYPDTGSHVTVTPDRAP